MHFGCITYNILAFPTNLTSIASQAFTDLPNVGGIRIPATVTSIANDAFDEGIEIIAPCRELCDHLGTKPRVRVS